MLFQRCEICAWVCFFIRHGFLYSICFLSLKKVDVLICGGIGGGAQMALSNAGIILYGGVKGFADDAVNDYLKGNLIFNPNVKCDHHDHEDGHDCGSHSCHNH
ncbi:MAG: NifB/NifX family molybdenum-iron cluster-binding protein [Alphaproteobacteria bacterium]|nr:NifB/NifX family molybdenum-iron cluster-binding protein [Alphaproteobacteria bacterium]